MAVRKSRISVPDLGSAFRSLAEEHAQKREAGARETTWARIQYRMRGGEPAERQVWSFSLPSFRWLPVAAALGLSAAAATYFLLPSDLEYQLRGANAVNGTIQPSGGDGAIDFSDGSRIELGRGSTIKVDVKGAHGAEAVLSTGELDVRVQHHSDTNYRFLAGPYEVRVIGTQFRLTWRPEAQVFSVVMKEGRVRVLGPAKLDQYLTGGETLRITGGSEPVAQTAEATAALNATRRPNRAARPRVAAPADIPDDPSLDARTPAAAEASEGRPLAAPSNRDALTWPALVAKGRFADVVTEADAFGLERALRERGASDLNALAHSANYTGRASLALSAWETLRQRFAGQSAARQAAFFLGRIQDQRGAQRDALRWLDTYLAEAPNDVYSSEALGRKLLVVQKLEGPLAARRVAREYVGRFPAGAYAQTARSMLSEP